MANTTYIPLAPIAILITHPPPPPHASQHTCIVDNGQISQWDLMGKINIMQSWDKKYVHLYTT